MNASYVSYLGSNWLEDGALEVDGLIGTIDTAVVRSIADCAKVAPEYVIATDLSHVRPTILEQIAEDPKTDWRTLTALAFSEYENVREAVADNKNTPISALLVLAHDNNPDVRFQLAENYNAPPLVLHILTEDDNPYIRWRAETTLQRLH